MKNIGKSLNSFDIFHEILYFYTTKRGVALSGAVSSK